MFRSQLLRLTDAHTESYVSVVKCIENGPKIAVFRAFLRCVDSERPLRPEQMAYQPRSQLVVAQIVLRARHAVFASVDLLPLQVGYAHQVRGCDAVLLRLPDREDRVVIGELNEVQPLHRHAVVVLDERAGAALHGLRILLLRACRCNGA